jgi:doublesex- and mab-3-related transcription factor 4/5
MDREGTQLLPGTFGATGSSQAATLSSSEATATSSDIPNSYPTCSRCRNHWLKIRVKGHRKLCKYRDCTCEKCSLVAEGQKLSALRMAVLRAQAQDEAHNTKQVSQHPEEVTVTHRVPSALDSDLKERVRNFVHGVTSGRTQTSVAVVLGMDSRSTESSNYLSAGGTTLSTILSTPVTYVPSLGETSDSLSSHTSTATQATALVASGVPATDSQALEGSGRTLPSAPFTDVLSLEGCCKVLYSSLRSARGGRLPIAPTNSAVPWIDSATFGSAVPWMNTSPREGSSSSLPNDGRLLPASPFGSAAPWMDSSYAVSTDNRSLPTVSNAETNSSQLPIWCGQVIPNCGSTTNVCYEMLLNQYYLNLRYLVKPS